MLVCNTNCTRRSSGVWDRQTTSLSSTNLTGCHCALWPLGAKLIYMLPVREILGRANCLCTERQPSLLWSLSISVCVYVHVRVCSFTQSLAMSRTSCTYLCQGKLKICVWILLINAKFMMLVVRRWEVEVMFIQISKQVKVSCTLWFTPTLGGVVMYGAQRAPCPCCASSVTRGPCSAWLCDSCPLLQQQTMKQPYIIGQLCPLKWWQTKPTESIKP